MAKKVVSVALRKKKPIKHSNKRKKLKTVLKRIFNYMKSDTYMFAPLAYRQSYTSPPASFVPCEPVKKKEKKLVEDVENYLKCDCYMYAPLLMDSAHDTATLHLGRNAKTGSDSNHQMAPRTEETTRKDQGNTLNSSRDIEYDDSYNPMKRIVVKHSMLQKEIVKHIAHQNCRTSSVPGKVLSQKEHRKFVVE